MMSMISERLAICTSIVVFVLTFYIVVYYIHFLRLERYILAYWKILLVNFGQLGFYVWENLNLFPSSEFFLNAFHVCKI